MDFWDGKEPTEKILRASSIDDAMDCSRRMIGRNFETIHNIKLNKPSFSIAAIAGTATHKAAQVMNTHKKAHGEINQNEYLEAGLDTLSDEIKVAGTDILFDATTANQNIAETQVRKMSHSYEVGIAAKIDVIENERPVDMDITEGWKLVGHIDQEISNGLRDLKTGVMKKYHVNQTGAYGILKHSEGVKPEKIFVDFVKRVGKTAAQPDVFTTEYDAGLVMAESKKTIIRIIRMVNKMERTGDVEFIPVNINSMLCSAKYCPAFHTDFCKISRVKKGE